jgi:hypothetical protein
MAIPYSSDFEAAAALFWALGGTIPHDDSKEEEARKIVHGTADREKLLLRIVSLCGVPSQPRQYYLLTKAYSWLGASYAQETIRCASAYLQGEPWGRLPKGNVRHEGILISQETAARASVLCDLAQAQAFEGNANAALANYMEAYRLEPYNAMCVIQAADLLARTRTREEALSFLKNQKSSAYYKPVKYTDERGLRKENDVFRQLLEAHIRKLEGEEEADF